MSENAEIERIPDPSEEVHLPLSYEGRPVSRQEARKLITMAEQYIAELLAQEQAAPASITAATEPTSGPCSQCGTQTTGQYLLPADPVRGLPPEPFLESAPWLCRACVVQLFGEPMDLKDLKVVDGEIVHTPKDRSFGSGRILGPGRKQNPRG